MSAEPPLFVDTVHLIGLFLQGDQWWNEAHQAENDYRYRDRVTTVGVLQEFLAHVSRRGPAVRQAAVELIDTMATGNQVRILEHDHRLVEDALRLFAGEFRYTNLSLQDCIAVQVMRELGMTDILTADQEFARAGVNPVLKVYG